MIISIDIHIHIEIGGYNRNCQILFHLLNKQIIFLFHFQ